MGRIFILLSILLAAGFVQASQINMYESGYPVNLVAMEKVFVGTNVVTGATKITMLSMIRPCANYPKNVDGDIYACVTTLTELSAYLKNNNILSLKGTDLANWILNSNITISCNAETKPQLIQYDGKNVYNFQGPLFTPKQ